METKMKRRKQKKPNKATGTFKTKKCHQIIVFKLVSSAQAT